MSNERNDQKNPTNQGGQKTPTDTWNKDRTSSEKREGTNQRNQSDKNQEVDYPDKKEKGIDPMHRPYIVGDDEDTDRNPVVDEKTVDGTDNSTENQDDQSRNEPTNRVRNNNPDQNY